MRTGKPIEPDGAAVLLRPATASIAEEAFAGDIIGIPNHGTLRIGDTLTEGEDILFRGMPNFAPEILRRVRLERPDEGQAAEARRCSRLAEEGVVQVFLPHDGSPAIVGVVGALQLDVLKERLEAEYGLPIDFEHDALLALPLDRRPTIAAELDSVHRRASLGDRRRPRRRPGVHGGQRRSR